MPKSTEVQRNYLRATDPLVKAAIMQPLSFRGKDKLTQIQREAIDSGILEVLNIIDELKKSTNDLTSEEKKLSIDIASTLVETGETPVTWLILKETNPQRAEKLFPIIRKIKDLMTDLIKINIDMNEYSIMDKQFYKNSRK
jgi:leucyl aminopeptidase (aminopeptidase T)